MGRYKEAIAHFQRAIELFPQYHKAYNNMGATYMKLGLEREGRACSKKHWRSTPDYAVAYQNLDPTLKRRLTKSGGEARRRMCHRYGQPAVHYATAVGNDRARPGSGQKKGPGGY